MNIYSRIYFAFQGYKKYKRNVVRYNITCGNVQRQGNLLCQRERRHFSIVRRSSNATVCDKDVQVYYTTRNKYSSQIAYSN